MLDDEQIVRLLMQPLGKYFQQKDIIEIIAVKGNYLGLQRDKLGWEVVHDSECSFEFWERLCNVISNSRGTLFDEYKQPKLSAVLPGNHRIEAAIGGVVDTGLSVSIRVKRDIIWSLADFGLDDIEANKLIQQVQDGANTIVVARTNGGKTSLLNTLIQYINGDKEKEKIRITSIEDAREIILPDPSISPQYIVSRNESDTTFGYSEAIDHLVRVNPGYIILGEISVKNAHPAIRMLNTGHKGFFSTIHANSPLDALDGAFVQNVEMAGYPSNNISKWLHKYFDIVIHLESRKIVEIFYPELDKQGIPQGVSKKFPENKKLVNRQLKLVDKITPCIIF